MFDTDEGSARQLLSVTDPDDWPPSIVAVSPRGEHVLVADPAAAGGRPICACSLVDGATGTGRPVKPLGPEARRSAPITGAMLSPDGSLLVTVSGRDGRQVAVRDVTTSNETVLLNEPSSTAPSVLDGAVRTWARNDTILVNARRNDRGTLLVIDRGR